MKQCVAGVGIIAAACGPHCPTALGVGAKAACAPAAAWQFHPCVWGGQMKQCVAGVGQPAAAAAGAAAPIIA